MFNLAQSWRELGEELHHLSLPAEAGQVDEVGKAEAQNKAFGRTYCGTQSPLALSAVQSRGCVSGSSFLQSLALQVLPPVLGLASMDVQN